MSEPTKDYPPYLDYPKPYKPPTNADRIRAMTDEELVPLARAFITTEDCPRQVINCEECNLNALCGSGSKRWLNRELEWLQQPAEDGDDR